MVSYCPNAGFGLTYAELITYLFQNSRAGGGGLENKELQPTNSTCHSLSIVATISADAFQSSSICDLKVDWQALLR